MQAGDKISFGDYEWRVLDVQDNTALIITEYVIEERSYHDVYKDITWEECSLRTYLNGEFYNKFSERDRSRIISVLNQNMDNQWYGTKGGADTWDRIFLLSLEEAACNYFGDSSSKLYHCRLPRYLTKPRQRRSEWDMAGSDGISRVSAVFRGKSLLTNKMRII